MYVSIPQKTKLYYVCSQLYKIDFILLTKQFWAKTENVLTTASLDHLYKPTQHSISQFIDIRTVASLHFNSL